MLGKAPAWNLRLLPFWYLMLYLARRAGRGGGLGCVAVTARGWRTASRIVRGPERGPRPRAVERADGRRRRSRPTSTLASDRVADADPEPEPARRRSRDRRATRIRVIGASRSSRSIATTVALVRVDATTRLPAVLGGVQLHRLRGRRARATSPQKSYPEYHAFMDTANALPPGRMSVGGQRRHRRVRHTARADAAAVLDRRSHHVDGGPLLRGVGDHAVPLPVPRPSRSQPSNAVRGLPYRTIADFDLGVRYLQLMGVRYYAAISDTGEERPRPRPVAPARSRPCPTSTASRRAAGRSTRWPTRRPVRRCVRAGRRRRPARRPELEVRRQARPLDGSRASPSSAPGSARGAVVRRSGRARPSAHRRRPGRVAARRRGDAARAWPKSALPRSRSRTSAPPTTSISFDVSRTGVPVMVKTSYYPNWEVEGAEGRSGRRPTSWSSCRPTKHVKLTYGTTSVEWVGRVLTLVGLVGLGVLVWWGLAARRRGRSPTSAGPDGGGEPDEAGVGRAPRRVRFPSRFPTVRTRGSRGRLGSTPSSRPTTFAASIPTRSTSRSPGGSATRSSRSPARPACSSAATPVRRRSRSSPRSSRARPIAGADVVDLGLGVHRPLLLRGRHPRRARRDVHRQPQPGAVQRHQAVPRRRRADRPGDRARRDQGDGRGRSARARRGSGPRRAPRPAARLRRARALVRRRRRARAAPGRRRHRQRRRRPRSCPAVFAGLPVRAHDPLRRARRHLPEPPRRPDQGREPQGPPARACSTTDADVGLAFDGDADRVVLVDDQAQPVSGSTTTAILAATILGRHPGETVVHNLICSKAVPEIVIASAAARRSAAGSVTRSSSR